MRCGPWPWIIVGARVHAHLSAALGHRAAFPHVDRVADRPRHGVPGDDALSPGGIPRARRRGHARRLPLDDRDAPQLGHVVPRARLLPPLPAAGTKRKSTTCSWAPHDGGAHDRRRADDVRARHGEGSVRPHSLDRRRYRTALPAALVLVAHQRVERDRGDGELVPRRARLLHRAEERRSRSRRSVAPHHGRVDVRSSGSRPPSLRTAGRSTKRSTKFYTLVRPAGPGMERLRRGARDFTGNIDATLAGARSVGCSAALSFMRRCSAPEAFCTGACRSSTCGSRSSS